MSYHDRFQNMKTELMCLAQLCYLTQSRTDEHTNLDELDAALEEKGAEVEALKEMLTPEESEELSRLLSRIGELQQNMLTLKQAAEEKAVRKQAHQAHKKRSKEGIDSAARRHCSR